jgi:hypothetical protein
MLNKDQYFTGTITEIVDPILYQIKVDIPGMASSVMAFPMRGEIDEPVVGDFVLLRSLDPIFNSYFLYQKIKENDFIGFRSNGKYVDITPDYILLGIFDPSTRKNDFEKDGDSEENKNDNQEAFFEDHGDIKHGGFRPQPTDWIKLDKDGNLEINIRANSTITINGEDKPNTIIIKGENEITVEKNSTIAIKGDSSIKVDGSTTLECPTIEVKSNSKIALSGGGSLETSAGTCAPTGSGGFCGIPTCPFSGAPHIGNKITGI